MIFLFKSQFILLNNQLHFSPKDAGCPRFLRHVVCGRGRSGRFGRHPPGRLLQPQRTRNPRPLRPPQATDRRKFWWWKGKTLLILNIFDINMDLLILQPPTVISPPPAPTNNNCGTVSIPASVQIRFCGCSDPACSCPSCPGGPIGK